MSMNADWYSYGYLPPAPQQIDRSGVSGPATSVQQIRSSPVAPKNELGRIGIGLRLDTALKAR